MPDLRAQAAELSAEEKRSFEAAIERFERAWHGPVRPEIAEFLPAGGRLRGTVLRELVEIDLEFRQQRGESVSQADYLTRFPELSQLSPQSPADGLPRATVSISPESTAASGEIAPSATPVAARFGRYEIIKELGQGAMGAVYLAQDTQLDRRVALKIPKFAAAETDMLLERFYREARAAAKLRHPNICPVFDVGQIDGRHYITMAFIEGRPLKDFIRANQPQHQRRAAAVIRKIALGLAQAHAEGVIHRDLKPANVMIDDQGEPVVMDFGLARRTADDVQATQDGTILGTPAYMSPEQAAGDIKQIGPAVDIYSLGVMLYELLTGRLPFTGDVIALLKQIAVDDPQPPSKLRPGLDPRLEAICLRMMAKCASDRFGSMDEVAQVLGEYLKTAGKAEPLKKSNAADRETVEHGETQFASVPPLAAAPVEETESHLLPSIVATNPMRRPQPIASKSPSPMSVGRHSAAVPTSATAALGKWLRHRVALGALGGAAVLLVVLGVVLFFRTPDGAVLRIVIEDPQVEVRVKGTEIVLSGAEQKDITLEPGELALIVRRGDFKFETRSLVLKRGERVTARVELLDGDELKVDTGRRILLHESLKGMQADRRAAEWVLSISGAVGVNGDDRIIRRASELPPPGFRLTRVGLIENEKVSDAGLANFEGCKNLTHLDLAITTKVSSAGMAYFRECKDLKHLDLGRTRVGDEGMAHFQGCNKLTYLSVGATQVTDAGLTYFRDCKKLTYLYLNRAKITDAGLAQFQDCNDLMYLFLSVTQVSDDALVHLQDCKNMRRLFLSGTQVSDAGLDSLAGMLNLQQLDLKETAVTEQGLAELHAKIPQSTIEWNGGTIKPAAGNVSGETIETAPDRQAAEWVLSIGGKVHVDGKDRDIRQAGELPQADFRLTLVDLSSNPRVTDAGLACFRGCQNLTDLVLFGTPVGDAGLVYFKDCKQLRQLNLGSTKVSDTGLKHFKDCKNLSILHLWGTGVTDTGLVSLRAFKNLLFLSLRGTAVSDAGLAHLDNMVQLRELALFDSNVTAEGVAELHKKIPRCTIKWDGGAIEP